MFHAHLRTTAVVAFAIAALGLSVDATANAATSVDQFALAGHRAYVTEVKAERAAFARQNARMGSCAALVQSAPPDFGAVAALSELTATEADKPAYETLTAALGKVSTGNAVLRSARTVIEREAKRLKQLVGLKLDLDPCTYYAGWKAAGWKQGYNPYPARIAALDFLPMYTPLANAEHLLSAAGGSSAKYATQLNEAALMTASAS